MTRRLTRDGTHEATVIYRGAAVTLRYQVRNGSVQCDRIDAGTGDTFQVAFRGPLVVLTRFGSELRIRTIALRQGRFRRPEIVIDRKEGWRVRWTGPGDPL